VYVVAVQVQPVQAGQAANAGGHHLQLVFRQVTAAHSTTTSTVRLFVVCGFSRYTAAHEPQHCISYSQH
jgi:hypothetical protein